MKSRSTPLRTLVVASDASKRRAIVDMVKSGDLEVQISEAESVARAWEVLGDPVEDPLAELRVGHLAAPEHDRDLDLVALVEELTDLAGLGVEVAAPDLRAVLHLLDGHVPVEQFVARLPDRAHPAFTQTLPQDVALRRGARRGCFRG